MGEIERGRQRKVKVCIRCGTGLDAANTTWYRQKNYIHKCHACIRTEKAEWARNHRPTDQGERSKRYSLKLIRENPKRYTARQQNSSARKRATALGLEFDLTSEYILSIMPDVCPVLGKTLKYGGGERCDESPALDRIDPAKGYVVGNVQIICFLANLMKSNASPADLEAFARWVLGGMRSFEKMKGVSREK